MKRDKVKRIAFMNWLNKTFKPEHPEYPIAGMRTDETFYITSESYAYDQGSPIKVVDYYGEYRGGYAWIHPKIEAEAKKRGLFLEWENAASVGVYIG